MESLGDKVTCDRSLYASPSQTLFSDRPARADDGIRAARGLWAGSVRSNLDSELLLCRRLILLQARAQCSTRTI